MILYRAYKFILKHKHRGSYKGWSNRDIMYSLQEAATNNTLKILVNYNEVVGVASWNSFPDYKLLHINQIVASGKKALRMFIDIFNTDYPGWDIQASRRGTLTRYKNTEKLIRKLYGRR